LGEVRCAEGATNQGGDAGEEHGERQRAERVRAQGRRELPVQEKGDRVAEAAARAELPPEEVQQAQALEAAEAEQARPGGIRRGQREEAGGPRPRFRRQAAQDAGDRCGLKEGTFHYRAVWRESMGSGCKTPNSEGAAQQKHDAFDLQR
jgi:hypothetical protein